MTGRILVIDDEAILHSCRLILRDEGREVEVARHADARRRHSRRTAG